jgi:hypothetical protein
MKKAIWFLFIALFLLSVSSVFAQSNESAVSAQDEQSVQNTVKIQKVIEIRKVVANGIRHTETAKKLEYDSKGGLIVPNASKGIKVTPQNTEKKAVTKSALQQTKDRSSKGNPARYQKDLTSRNVQSKAKTDRQKEN